jgi:hypothetical protein
MVKEAEYAGVVLSGSLPKQRGKMGRNGGRLSAWRRREWRGGGLVIAWGSRGRRGPVWEEGGGRMGHAEDVCQPWGETKRAGPKVIVESSYLFKKFQKT